MEAELTLEPVPEQLPQPGAFSLDRPAASVVDSIGTIPAAVAERVTIAPPPTWVSERPLEQDTTGNPASNRYLLVDHQYHLERHQSYLRTVRKLDTIKAVRTAGQFRIEFDPRCDRLVIHSLAVVRGEQRAENARMERLRLLQREAGLESLVIEGLLTVVALLEDVRVGDVLDLSYTLESRSRIFPNHFSFWRPLPEHTPIQTFHLSARFTSGRALQWKSNDPNLKPDIREAEGETEWKWTTSIIPIEDEESHLLAWHRVGKWIQISGFASWAEVVSGFAAAWEEDLECPEIVHLAESIFKETTTAAQRAERVLTFLQDDIRYLSVSGDLGGTVPAAPGTTIKRGFGDCKDKSFAAAHLLRRLGIPARPVLVHSAFCQFVREFLPMPGAFDHAIVEFEIDGQRRWIDVTASLQGGTALSRPGAPFQLGLPIGPGVSDLEPIAHEVAGDRLELRETFLIDTSGRSSSLRVVTTATGREAERWRRSVASDGVEAFARSREQFYQQPFPNLKRAGKLEYRDDRENNEFVIGEVFDLYEFGTRSNGRQGIQIRMPAYTVQSVLAFRQRGKRCHPWVLQYPCRIRHIIELESPSLRKPTGKSARVDSGAFRFSSAWQGHQGSNTITFNLQVLQETVAPADFEFFKKDVLEVWRHTSILVNLPPGSSVPWKKRSLGNVVSSQRNPVRPTSSSSYEPPPGATIPLPPIAPPCTPQEKRENREAMAPRREKGFPSREPANAPERNRPKRPNPVLPPQDDLQTASSGRRRSRRQARRAQRRRLVLGVAVLFVALLLASALFFLLHRR
jgi:hypothetical protein